MVFIACFSAAFIAYVSKESTFNVLIRHHNSCLRTDYTHTLLASTTYRLFNQLIVADSKGLASGLCRMNSEPYPRYVTANEEVLRPGLGCYSNNYSSTRQLIHIIHLIGTEDIDQSSTLSSFGRRVVSLRVEPKSFSDHGWLADKLYVSVKYRTIHSILKCYIVLHTYIYFDIYYT